jgi:hypothetical protein
VAYCLYFYPFSFGIILSVLSWIYISLLITPFDIFKLRKTPQTSVLSRRHSYWQEDLHGLLYQDSHFSFSLLTLKYDTTIMSIRQCHISHCSRNMWVHIRGWNGTFNVRFIIFYTIQNKYMKVRWSFRSNGCLSSW